MNITHEYGKRRTVLDIDESIRFCREHVTQDYSIPAAPEPWTIDAFEDILSCHKFPSMDDFGSLWDRSGSVEQWTTLFD